MGAQYFMGGEWSGWGKARYEGLQAMVSGLDAAGKTTILYKLQVGEITTLIPAIGLVVEEIKRPTMSFRSWDVGGCDKIPLWRHYYPSVNAIIFVVDSRDYDRAAEAQRELNKILQDGELHGVPLLVFANKQDLPGAMSGEELTRALGLHDILDREWTVRNSCAITGAGLSEGLEWLHARQGRALTPERFAKTKSANARVQPST